MRNDYYDYKWTKTPRPGQANRAQQSGVEPYGAVPSQTGQPQPPLAPAPAAEASRRTPNTWQRPAKPKKKKRGKTGVPVFLCCLVLLLGLSGLAVYLQGGIVVPDLWWTLQDILNGEYRLPPWANDSPWNGEDPWGGDWWYEAEEDNWTERLPGTTVGRAPLGDGTTLPLNSKTGEPLTAQEVYEKVNPSVVGVRSQLTGGAMSMGSGVIMSADGYILTNAHVIAGSRRLDVLFSDGNRVNALLVGYDSATDLAVLKVVGKNLPVADFVDSATLRVGDPAYAIGNPLGEVLRGTMTDGMVSAIDRVVTAENGSMTLIQTTAALNPGNSGGALVNAAGQVVGITNMKMMAYGDEVYEGLGFAIPADVVKEVVDQIIAQGYYDDKVPLLGITVYTVEPEGKVPGGACVQAVEAGSDAWKKGVRPGDIIVKAGGQAVNDLDDLLNIKNQLGVGDTLTLEIWRPDGRVTVKITLMTRRQMEAAK